MIKLIEHTGECDHPDDPDIPFRLELVMRAPSFVNVAFVGLFGGTEDVVVRGASVEEIVEWMERYGLADHPRLIRFEVKEGDQIVFERRPCALRT